ncbi:16S rRNA (guanine(966)-N(2))-methyltransferase RsmD [Clostridium subterminale]|uniref:16S rRNA (Guanine(966)-N(2))-methyltransferase RsmD n=1 Tax=Clostridium subterminale TaxID=1550 RepID=A0ABN1KKC1_CLOSU
MRVIAGKAKGRKLLSPEGMGTRPTLDRIKESIFNIIQNKVRGSIVLDQFSGTGSLGLEAASRGAKECHLIDMGDVTYKYLKQNIINLKFEDFCTSYKGDSYKYLEEFGRIGRVFDLIFIDPPYAKEMIPPALTLIKKYNLLQRDGLIVTKIDSSEEIYEGYEDIVLIDQRKYGNTTVCFYEFKE